MIRHASLLSFFAVLVLACASLPAAAGRPTARSDDRLPAGELGETIRLGRELVEQTNTRRLVRPHGGNDLRRSSCQLEADRDPRAATLFPVAWAYHAWSPAAMEPRSRRVLRDHLPPGSGLGVYNAAGVNEVVEARGGTR